MPHGLALFATTGEIASPAVLANLSDVPSNRLPTSDLSFIIRPSPSHVVSAVPLKPAARVLFVNPACASPFRERL
jgi:hypothetical protein